TYDETPRNEFTINSTDSGDITINLPALLPRNATITITSNLAGPAIAKVERRNNDTGNWDEVTVDLSRATLDLVPGVYRFTTRVIPIDQGAWTEVLAAENEYIIEGLNSGSNSGIE